MSEYVSTVRKVFEENKNLSNALPMKKYMKERYEFLGIKSPLRKELSQEFLTKDKRPGRQELPDLINELWGMEEREFQYFAIALAEKFARKPERDWINLYKKMIVTKSWWDTVDGIASNLVGPYFKAYPQSIEQQSEKWMDSGDMWLQRTVLLFQLKYKKDTDIEFLINNILRLKSSKEFFIQKAIGWSLRELSKTEPDVVQEFVKNHELAPLSRREALKVINRRK